MREIEYYCSVCGEEIDYPYITLNEGVERHNFLPCQTCISEAGERGITAALLNIQGDKV